MLYFIRRKIQQPVSGNTELFPPSVNDSKTPAQTPRKRITGKVTSPSARRVPLSTDTDLVSLAYYTIETPCRDVWVKVLPSLGAGRHCCNIEFVVLYKYLVLIAILLTVGVTKQLYVGAYYPVFGNSCTAGSIYRWSLAL